jgi:hypothetical protein
MRTYQISRKSLQWEPSADGRTDTTKLRAAFRTFANAPNKHLLPPSGIEP